jgi:hypothetical protein
VGGLSTRWAVARSCVWRACAVGLGRLVEIIDPGWLLSRGWFYRIRVCSVECWAVIWPIIAKLG